jgi:hypothetical protein
MPLYYFTVLGGVFSPSMVKNGSTVPPNGGNNFCLGRGNRFWLTAGGDTDHQKPANTSKGRQIVHKSPYPLVYLSAMAGVVSNYLKHPFLMGKLINPEPTVFSPRAGLEPARPSFLYRYPKNQRLAKQLVEKAAVWGRAKNVVKN